MFSSEGSKWFHAGSRLPLWGIGMDNLKATLNGATHKLSFTLVASIDPSPHLIFSPKDKVLRRSIETTVSSGNCLGRCESASAQPSVY